MQPLEISGGLLGRKPTLIYRPTYVHRPRTLCSTQTQGNTKTVPGFVQLKVVNPSISFLSINVGGEFERF